MKYLVPGFGALLLGLAVYVSIAECRRALVAARGDLKALRQLGICWMVLFALALGAALVLKLPALYLAVGGLALVIWITMPAAVYIGWKIRTEGPMGVGKKSRR